LLVATPPGKNFGCGTFVNRVSMGAKWGDGDLQGVGHAVRLNQRLEAGK
jgi:hypothetical protein